MITYTISVGTIVSHYEASDEACAVLAFVNDAGYRSVADAADVLGMSEDQFLRDIRVGTK